MGKNKAQKPDEVIESAQQSQDLKTGLRMPRGIKKPKKT